MIYGKIWKRANGTYVINNGTYGVDETSQITVDAVQAYLLDHPEALIPEPVPPPPTEEELAARRVAEARALLASTDWIIAKVGEAQILGNPIDALLDKYAVELGKRAEARETINGEEA